MGGCFLNHLFIGPAAVVGFLVVVIGFLVAVIGFLAAVIVFFVHQFESEPPFGLWAGPGRPLYGGPRKGLGPWAHYGPGTQGPSLPGTQLDPITKPA